MLLGDGEEKLEKLVQKFESVCQRRNIMKIGENGVNMSLNDRKMEEVETHRDLVVDASSDGGMGEEVNHWITEAKKAWGALKDEWKKRHISQEAKVGMYEGIIEPSLLYGCEVWTLKVCERKRMEAIEMKCFEKYLRS